MKTFLVVTAVLSSLMVGCDEEPTTPVTPPQAQPAKPAEPVKSMQDQAKDIAAEGKQAVQSAIDEAKPRVEAAATQVKEEVQQIAFDYQKKLDEVVTYFKANKVDQADKSLAEVEAKKDSMPASFQDRVASLRKMIDTAKKTTTGISLPKF